MALDLPLPSLLSQALRDTLLDLRVAVPGIVKSYDAATKRATITPGVKRPLSPTESEEQQSIPDVPIAWPGGGGVALHFALTPGDAVILLFSDVDFGEWYQTGELTDPSDRTLHGSGSPWAIPIQRAPTSQTGDSLQTDSFFTIGAEVGADFVPVETKVQAQLTALKAAITGAVVVAQDGGASLKSTLLAALASWPSSTASSSLKASP